MRIDEVRKKFESQLRYYPNEPTLVEMISMCNDLEKTIRKFIDGEISVNQYIDGITPFDKYAFTLYWGSKQKSNWLNTGQNKSYPIIKETIWAAVFEVVRRKLLEHTNINYSLIQGEQKKVAVSVFEDGTVKYKDVDVGIGLISEQGYTIPVIAGECKGGHACSTCHDGIWGQGIRMKKQFPHALQAFITDNNITVNKKIDESQYSDGIDIEFCERGINNNQKFTAKEGEYVPLNPIVFQQAIDILFDVVSSKSKDHWTKMNKKYGSSGQNWRDSLDENGYYVNKSLLK